MVSGIARWWLQPRARRGLLLVGSVSAIGLALLLKPPPAVPQPIAFNHQVHVQKLGLGCEFCHQYVSTGAHAGLPGGERCGLCHQAPQGDSPEAARLTALLAAGAPLRFNKLFRLPDHVAYTHRRHVGIAKLECVQCHGRIAETDRPPPRALVRIDMNFCRSCHRAKEQSLDCVACHR